MENRRLKLLQVLRTLPDQPNMTDFAGRLYLQKAIYLLEALGTDLGYSFGWYLRGPYSSELAADGFALDPLFRNKGVMGGLTLENYLNEDDSQHIERLKGLITEATEGDQSRRVYWLELISSVHYLYKNAFPKASKEKVFQALQGVKNGRFKEPDIGRAWQLLVNHGLVG